MLVQGASTHSDIDGIMLPIGAVYMLLNALYYQHLVAFVSKFVERKPPDAGAIRAMKAIAGVLAVVMALATAVHYIRRLV